MAAVGSMGGRPSRKGFGQIGTTSARLIEPPLANKVTLLPRVISSSVSQ